jgi:hypothetical protein
VALNKKPPTCTKTLGSTGQHLCRVDELAAWIHLSKWRMTPMPDQKPILDYRKPAGEHLPAFDVFLLVAKWGAFSLIAFGLFMMVVAAVFHVL